MEFQSTLPARGATATLYIGLNDKDISIHAPRTGSDKNPCENIKPAKGISIHAPRTGSDIARRAIQNFRQNFNPRSPHGERLVTAAQLNQLSAFQSTLPARGATAFGTDFIALYSISIHAPRTGSD